MCRSWGTVYFPSHPIATLCSDFLTPATYRVCIRVGGKKKKKRKLSYFVDGIKSDRDRWGGKTFFKNPISLNHSYNQKMPGDALHQRAPSSLRGPWLLSGETGWPGAASSPSRATTVVVLARLRWISSVLMRSVPKTWGFGFNGVP